MKRFFQKRLKILSATCALVLFISQIVGRQHWFLELFTHFSFHYGVCFLLAAIFLTKHWRYACLALGIAILAWSLLPPQLPDGNRQFVVSSTTQPVKSNSESLSIIMANVNINNPNPQQHLNRLISFQPDILLLPEAGGIWKKPLDTLKDYPHRCGHDEASPFALQVLAKQPINCDIHFIANLPYARIGVSEKIIYAIHPPPPIGRLALTRNLYLKILGKRIKDEKQPTIVTGDFNLTPFSPIYRDFLAQTGLKPTTQKYSPSWSILGFPFYLPLDYALCKNMGKGTQLRIKKLPKYGSDHHGVWILLETDRLYNHCQPNHVEDKSKTMSKRKVTDQFTYEILPPIGDVSSFETGDTISLLHNLPYLLSTNIIPSEPILNDILSKGIDDAGMSGGVKWQPYTLDDNQFNTLVDALKKHHPSLEYVEPAEWVKNSSDWHVWLMFYKYGVPWEKHKALTDEYNCIIEKMNAAYDAGNKERGQALHLKSVTVGTELADFVMEHTNEP